MLNRGLNSTRPILEGVRFLHGNAREADSMREATKGLEFDSVVNFVAFTAADVTADLDLFRGRTGQYVFISSASAYQTPPAVLPVLESTPLRNPVWAYSQHKIAAEENSSPPTATRTIPSRSCGPRTPTTRAWCR